MSEAKTIHASEACLTMDQMSNYLLHRLDEEQEKAVDQHLAECELCCGAMERLSAQIEKGDTVLQDAHRRHAMVQQQLDALAQETKAPSKTTRRRQWLRVAAVIIVILLPLPFLFAPQGPTDSQALFTAYYKPYDDMLTVRSGETAGPVLQAFEAYNRGDFVEAVKLFERIPPEEVTTAITLFTGLAHLEANELPEAQNKLAEVAKTPGLLQGPAAWYLALAHLKAGELEEASAALDRIPHTDTPYHSQGEDLKAAIKLISSETEQ